MNEIGAAWRRDTQPKGLARTTTGASLKHSAKSEGISNAFLESLSGVTQTVEANLRRIMSMLGGVNPGIVAIDGRPGVGKSYFARALGLRASIDVVTLDDFVRPNQGRYLDALDYEGIRSRLGAGFQIVEGLCVLAVLGKLGLAPTVHVYVTPMGGTYELSEDAGLSWHIEVLDYEKEFSPHLSADLLFVNELPQESSTFNREIAMSREAIDIAYINAKTRLAIALAFGGFLTLGIGLAVLIFAPVSSAQETLIQFLGLEVSARGMGAIIMSTSVVWGYLAYSARPNYSHRLETFESGTPDGAFERSRIESSTAALLEPLDRPPEPPPA